MKFGIYIADGTVIRTGECPDVAIGVQAQEGEFLYAGAISITDRVDPATGKRIAVNVPQKPGEHYRYDSPSNKWLPDMESAWASVKRQRDALLKATDWRVLRAMDVGTPMNESWLQYRQSLRDITQQTDPFNIVWPVIPN